MTFSSSEFTLLPQPTNDKHLWTMAAICWVFQSILSWNWLALYEKCTENCHAYQGKSSHNSAFFFVHLQLWIFFWWIHWDVLKNIHIGLHVMQFILILLTVCKQKLKTRCNCVQLPNCRFWFWHPWMHEERGYSWEGVLLLILLWNIIWAFVWWFHKIWRKFELRVLPDCFFFFLAPHQ